MGIFDKIFGSKEPAPKVQIHPDDLALVKNSDLKWWDNLSLDNVISYEKQDNAFSRPLKFARIPSDSQPFFELLAALKA